MRIFSSMGLAGPVVAAALFVGSACGCTATPSASEPARSDHLKPGEDTVVIPVRGMTCGGCEAAIELAVKKLDGVLVVDADHRKGETTVTYVKDKVTVEQVLAAINKSGFQASIPGKKEDP